MSVTTIENSDLKPETEYRFPTITFGDQLFHGQKVTIRFHDDAIRIPKGTYGKSKEEFFIIGYAMEDTLQRIKEIGKTELDSGICIKPIEIALPG